MKKEASLQIRNTLLFSFRRSLPIMVAFFPIGLAYGILMQDAGYNALWSGACSTAVFAGSLQFLMVSFFGGDMSMSSMVVLALLLNSRHIFYGVSFIDRFRSYDRGSKWFLVFSLADENYSLHCAYQPQEGIDEKWAHVFTAALVMLYWVIFSVLGGIAGNFIPFDTTGIDFSLTALFVVILVDQIKDAKSKIPALIAVVSSAINLVVFGSDRFILPSLLVTIAALILLRKTLAPKFFEGGSV